MRNLLANGLIGLVLGVLLSAAPAGAATLTLTGEVTYRERIALPDGASLRVRLVDLTARGTPTRVEAEAAIASPGQVPLTFTLNFDDNVLIEGNRHALVAEISSGLELWFRNAEPLEVDPRAAAGPVIIVANFVGRLVEPVPAPTSLPSAEPTILDVTWRADTIRGAPVAGTADSTLSITGDMRAGGRGGCNSYFAQAEIAGEAIRFSAVAATRMACSSDGATAQETAFFGALAAARFWQLDGDALLLLSGSGAELVRFARSAR